jgi:surfactin synthase thioesterase subunit
VLVHGIGRQRVNASLQSFARAVAGPDAPLYTYAVPPGVGAPDQERLSAVLRAADRSSTHVDFYELYWADLMSDGAVEPMLRFLATLAWRPAAGVPRALLAAYIALWVLVAALLGTSAVAAAYVYLAAPAALLPPPWQLAVWAVAVLVAWGWSGPLAARGVAVAGVAVTLCGLFTLLAFPAVFYAGAYATAYTVIHTELGNSLCYLLLDPARVADRRAIQRRGVELLRALHAARYADAPKPFYDDLVVVGHSMGSVVALDVLHQLWAATAMESLREVTPTAELRAAEAAAAALARNGTSSEALSAYRRAQRALQGHPDIKDHWRVSGLVTLGSPLAHADVLLAEGPEKLREQVDRHELPSCPPALEPAGTPFEGCFSYRFGGNKDSNVARRMSRSAVFGPTQWTNLFFPMVSLLDGDVIGGPVAPRFGPGVADRKLTGPAGRFLHTAYWEVPDEHLSANDAHLRALRKALGLNVQQ